MAKKLIPPDPSFLPPEKRSIYYALLNQTLSDSDKLLENASLDSITTRPHSALQSVGAADETDTDTVFDKHVSNALMKEGKDHRDATSAHGATGNVVGDGDFATEIAYGVVKKAAAQSDAATSSVSVDSADAGATYTAAEQTLINELKTDVNTLVTDLNNAITVVNDLIDKLQTAGQMA